MTNQMRPAGFDTSRFGNPAFDMAIDCSRPLAPGGAAPTVKTIVKMTTLLGSLRERMLQMQGEAANVAIAEMTLRRLNERDGSALVDGAPLRATLHDENHRRIAALTQAWFDVIASAHAAMSELAGRSDNRLS